MKEFIKIKNSKWAPGSNNKMIHEDEEGRLFLGPPLGVEDKTYIVEVSAGRMEDGYYHIIKVVGKI